MVNKHIPFRTFQLIVHSASGQHMTPQGRTDAQLQVRLWRSGYLSAADTTRQWSLIPVNGNSGMVRIKNAYHERCVALPQAKAGTELVYAKTSNDDSQLWEIRVPDSAQADFVIASALDPNLVISPKEGSHDPETPLEVEEFGPWSDQFWRLREPRSAKD
ncbi:hypothetical protein J2Z21_009582 [Streptomyces griseochromogenes]|uniref:Ricin B lectin domain-containing protein n=1 Tax=Streptomyces griseochromogenes TaxID=68214 RepID=A0A1B1AX06_9ACTN|nr:RICIN domain-containing protein [Streptomyces griseochromogenes]ANP51103.1 hypothetical protein AVL59_17065 [Streptomyces griseochromogenes]MBP2056563.1 hypothetical protein [Streptomyces griseochromogenes]